MKKAYYLIGFIFSLAFIVSCSDLDTEPVLNMNNAIAATITGPASGTDVTMTKATSADEAITFNWEAADFGVVIPITYQIQLDLETGDFTNPQLLGTTGELSMTLTQLQLTTAMIALGIDPGVLGNVKYRVVAIVNDEIDPVPSESLSFTGTPFDPFIRMYLPGNYQGWDPSTAPSIFAILDGDGNAQSVIYEGYVNLTSDDNEFKLTAGPGWEFQIFGDADPSGTSGDLAKPGNNIKVIGAGVYKIWLDTVALKYLPIVKTDWGIIGPASPTGGWDSDADMTYDVAQNVWTLTADMTAGEFKFRANDAWTLNMGDNDADGSLEQDGTNIVLGSGGNYTVVLDLSNSTRYTYSLTKN